MTHMQKKRANHPMPQTHQKNLIPLTNIDTYQTINRHSLEVLQKSLHATHQIQMNQIHGNNHLWIEKDMLLSSNNNIIIPDTDALITSETHVTLLVKTADCLPILIAHPDNIIAIIHAGRAGTEEEITKNTLRAIKKRTGHKKGFTIWFGPSICKHCYEINPITNQTYDLHKKNSQQIEMEVEQSTIIKSPHCTACHNDLFFSYRKGDHTKRNWSTITQRTGD